MIQDDVNGTIRELLCESSQEEHDGRPIDGHSAGEGERA